MGRQTHARLFRVQGKVLPNDLLTGGHGDFDGAIDHGVHQLLDGSLHRLPHALLQLRMRLQQRDLRRGEERVREPPSRAGGSQQCTYTGVDVDVWSQAGQGIHVNVVVAELGGRGPRGCTGRCGGSWC